MATKNVTIKNLMNVKLATENVATKNLVDKSCDQNVTTDRW
jgi:hypothetical protein